jgi:polyhydroxybutyrate depolymerase
MRLTMRAVVVLGLAAGGSIQAHAAEELRVDTRDGARSAILAPAQRARAPTVIVLHGALISAEYTAHWYGFIEAAADRGFAAVFPRGINLLWNDGREAWTPDTDDVGFVRRLVRDLVARGITDPTRLYLVGVSSGGMLTFRMLCEAPELFAGAATIIAGMPTGVGAACRLQRPVPVVMLNGTADPIVPYVGGGVGLGGWQGTVWPVERTAAFLARRNGCGVPSKAAVAGSAAPDAIRVVKLNWGRCSSERGVTLYRVEGGGHQVYGHTNFLPLILGSGTNEVSASAVIMRTFDRP